MTVDDLEVQHFCEVWTRYADWWPAKWPTSMFYCEDVGFRVFQVKELCWIHFYHDPNKTCWATEVIGTADWMYRPFDLQVEDILVAIRKKQHQQADRAMRGWVGDQHSRERYPLLSEFLTLDVFEDGSKRARGTIAVMAIDNSWRAVLNDKDTGEGLWATADSLVGLLEALEIELGAEEPNWKANRQHPNGGKKK